MHSNNVLNLKNVVPKKVEMIKKIIRKIKKVEAILSG
jgi:hypothetical protein